jgi:hypothetical protein
MVQLAAPLGDPDVGDDPVDADDPWVGCVEVPWVGWDEDPPQAAADNARDTRNVERTLRLDIACTPSVRA